MILPLDSSENQSTPRSPVSWSMCADHLIWSEEDTAVEELLRFWCNSPSVPCGTSTHVYVYTYEENACLYESTLKQIPHFSFWCNIYSNGFKSERWWNDFNHVGSRRNIVDSKAPISPTGTNEYVTVYNLDHPKLRIYINPQKKTNDDNKWLKRAKCTQLTKTPLLSFSSIEC